MKKLYILLLFTFVWQLQAQRSDFKTISFEKADSKASSFKGKELNNLPLLAHNLTYTLETDVERFRAIYFWVCNNIKNDYGLMMKNDRKRRQLNGNPEQLNLWNKTFKRNMFRKLLNEKKTLCTGYAFLVKELSNLAGLDCEIVTGYGKTTNSFKDLKMPNHAWNVVKLNGKWYLCDATWSSGFIDEDYSFTFNFNNDYFLMSPEVFAKNHKPLNAKWLLIKDDIE